MSVQVRWGKESFTFEYPAPETPLEAVRYFVAERTGLEHNSFKLIHAGAIMKDNSAPISAYRITPKSTIHVVGSNDPPLRAPSSAPTSKPTAKPSVACTEQSIVEQIKSELAAVRQSLGPEATRFIEQLSSGDPITEQMSKDHRRLGELLLQTLLRLDAINPDGEWEDARRERKTAVKEVQAILDNLDTEWANRKS
ncbi:hypothetical protein DL96DRAFT_1528383 [Flagelloscypha sp. PMI_526]|nr:hypothetical protein DL96DRAFT_1528383 [Flagelloscypha sp. PMI_526]